MALSKEVRSLRVVRVRLDDGRRVIGVRYPLPLISEVARTLSAMKHKKQEEHAKVSVAVPTAAKDFVFEVQVPVNEKFKRKALTPPVSLKTFFHVEPKLPNVDSNSAGTAKQKEGSDKSHKLPLKTKELDKPKAVQMKLLDSFNATPTGMPRAQSPSDKAVKIPQ
ncbi:hypothetical protein GBAR_LOCUS3420 [Geodia barretti]|uniref:Uncharacterized protein n=1 Tax=Geodia barretti TaxID=519541 RepID=A0AA35W0S6_GEOBA|nr:hypothetical protein GBAR_LOCUS3420 [Geodia barretti]